MKNEEKLIFDAAYQPQVRGKMDTRRIMLNVIIALIPALGVGVWQFGVNALILTAVSVGSAVLWEWLYRKLLKKSNTIGDLSAAVTGMMMAMSMPSTAPWWLPPIGTFFAIVVVKQLYGGLGKNFLNPALAGRAFLIASYASYMTTWAVPNALQMTSDAVSKATPSAIAYAAEIDAVTMATPMSFLYSGEPMPLCLSNVGALFVGMRPGCLGEISALALLVGGIYLMIRKIINWRIPVSFIGTVCLLNLIFGHEGYGNFSWMVYNLFAGSLFLGAIFMATDYATTPVTLPGQLLYGVGCGCLTVLIRYFGSFPEGVSYSILIMNLCAWPIDKLFRRKPFGTPKPVKEGTR